MSLDRYRTAIVTGASRGIGAAIVRQLRIGGLEVWAVARTADDLSQLARETGCRPLALDITHRDAVLSALSGLDADVLVNNASALVKGGVSWETAPDAIDALTAVNIKGTLNCLAATVPGMKARGRGHIVNLGSIAAVSPIPGMPVYAMTKAAILAGPGRDRRAPCPGRGSRGGPPTLLRRLRLPAARRHRRGRHVRAGRAAAHGRELHGDRAHRPVLRRLAVPSAAAMSATV
jgi:hypothetical protein